MTPGTRRFDALDALRGIAACMVLFFHLNTSGWLTNTALVGNSWMFVDLFFALSGFVIHANYGQRLREGYSLLRYMWLRLGRIYPLYAFALLLFVLLELALFGFPDLADRAPFTGQKDPASLFLNLSMLQIFGFIDTLTWNAAGWSVAAEFWTYLIAALMLRWTGRYFWIILALVALTSGAVIASGEPYLNRTWDMALARALLGFGLGMMTHALFQRIVAVREMPGDWRATAAEIAAMLTIFAWVGTVGESPLSIMAPLVFCAALLVFAFQRGLVSRLLLMRPFQVLGLWSYSIYLMHGFVIGRVTDILRVVQRETGASLLETAPNGNAVIVFLPDAIVVAILAITIMVAWLTYSLVERPARDWSRHIVQHGGKPALS